MVLGDVSTNFSKQTNEQTSKTTQISTQEVSNTNKQENIQDYVTYIRLSTRNTDNLSTNCALNIRAMATANAANKVKIKSCNTGNQMIKIAQDHELHQKITKKFDGMINDINTLKQQQSNSSDTSTTTNQGSSTEQGGDASAGLDSRTTEDSKQKDTQESFSKFMSPIRLSQSFTTTLNNRCRPFDYSISKSPAFDKWFHDFLRSNKKNVKENFFCAVACVNINESQQENIQYSENRQESSQLLKNNTEIAQRISAAYDKISEVVNEINRTSNTEMNDEASEEATLINEVDIDTTGCGSDALFAADVDITQRTNTIQDLALDTIVQRLTTADIDQTQQAYMADMMGLTQDASALQKAAASTEMTAVTDLTASQVATQTAGSSLLSIVFLIIVAIVAIKIVPMILGEVGDAFSSKKKKKESGEGNSPFSNYLTWN